ncbi:VOC family protein [Actinomadura fibrosa]|uniref:VOC family protein n=1 Tax=Actinomadura fibrosa TaxID=111802 RepID=A0ABW2XTB9_9ACTN|nr:VOC family protein [Actinomadura fibrosa]
MRWSHVGLTCADPRRTADFYARWFGFAIARVVPYDGQEIIFIRKDGAYLELFPPSPQEAPEEQEAHCADGDGPNVRGLVRHIAFQTDDVDAFLAEMGEAADVTLGPVDFDAYIPGWRTAWLRDPDGVIVEVSQGYRDDGDVPVACAVPHAAPHAASHSAPRSASGGGHG